MIKRLWSEIMTNYIIKQEESVELLIPTFSLQILRRELESCLELGRIHNDVFWKKSDHNRWSGNNWDLGQCRGTFFAWVTPLASLLFHVEPHVIENFSTLEFRDIFKLALFLAELALFLGIPEGYYYTGCLTSNKIDSPETFMPHPPFPQYRHFWMYKSTNL
jgi:hypothetical protein